MSNPHSSRVPLRAAEFESIGLCVVLEAVNDMVNHTMLALSEIPDTHGEAEVRFPTRTHQSVFLSRLLDFAHERGDAALTGVNGSCLGVLAGACETRSFDHEDSIAALAHATSNLRDWLDTTTTLQLWLPTLDIDAVLSLPRLDYLYISGNQVKHNLARLTAVAKKVGGILSAHGYSPPLPLIPLALDDFRVHLEDHFFVYYCTWLAELLNNVRWGLQAYLRPTFDRAYVKVPGDSTYRYEFPATIVDPVAREWFWRLMNHVRTGPYFPQFVGASYLKRESLAPGNQ